MKSRRNSGPKGLKRVTDAVVVVVQVLERGTCNNKPRVTRPWITNTEDDSKDAPSLISPRTNDPTVPTASAVYINANGCVRQSLRVGYPVSGDTLNAGPTICGKGSDALR